MEVLDDGALTDRIYDNADFDMFNWGWYVDVDPSSILRS
jgi:peptide/nickel transport system substrate-binding protein